MKTVKQNDAIQILTDVTRYNGGDTMSHSKIAIDHRAEFARDMIRTWGLVAAKPAIAAEGTTGSTYVPLTPAEIVDRACETADLAFKEFETRGWLLRLPEYQNLRETVEDQAPAP